MTNNASWHNYQLQQLRQQRADATPKPDTKPDTAAWKCTRCGKRLPTRGRVWAWRHSHYSGTGRSGYLCDNCADNAESGMDY